MTCKDCYHCNACFGHDEEAANREYPPAEKCRDFKDKSRIVELPCKVGDTLYFLPKYVEGFIYDEVEYVRIEEDYISVKTVADYYFCEEDFGRTVFLAREEAEEALRKEREK